jgi:hypothetical protein
MPTQSLGSCRSTIELRPNDLAKFNLLFWWPSTAPEPLPTQGFYTDCLGAI